MTEAYSRHTILKKVYDPLTGALKIVAANGGGSGSEAYTEHTIWRKVYDPDTEAFRVTEIGGGGASITDARFAGYLGDNIAVSDDWTDINWNSTDKNELTHTDGTAEITFDRDVPNCIIMVTLVSDYDLADETHSIRLVKTP